MNRDPHPACVNHDVDIFGVQVFYIAAGFICILMAGVGLADKQLINLDQQGAVAKTMEPEAIAG